MNFFDRLRFRWANSHPFWRFVVLLLVLGGLALFAGGPALGYYRAWRTDRISEDADRALSEGRYAEARDLAIQVLQRGKAEEGIYPTLLNAADELGDPRRADVAIAIVTNESFSDSQRLKAWQVLCLNVPAYTLIQAWATFGESYTLNEDFLLPFADRLLRDRMPAEAIELLAAMPEPRSLPIEARILRAMRIEGTSEAFAQLQRRLVTLLEKPDDGKSTLLEAIDDIPQQQLLPELYTILKSEETGLDLSDVETSLRLARYEIAARLNDGDWVMRQNFDRFVETHPQLLARWFIQLGRPAAALQCLDLEEPAEELEHFQLQCELLLAAGQFDKLRTFLKTPPSKLSKWQLYCQRAQIAEDQKERRKIEGEALKAAAESNNLESLIDLAREAEDRGLSELGLNAWTAAILRARGPLPISISIKHVVMDLSEARRENELVAVLGAFGRIEPANPVVVLQFAYLACLTGRLDPQVVIEAVEPIYEKQSDQLPVICTLALARLLSGEAEEAVRLTDPLKIDWFQGNPSYRAIRGLILASSDRVDEAAVYFEGFPWHELLPSEERIFREMAQGKGLKL